MAAFTCVAQSLKAKFSIPLSNNILCVSCPGQVAGDSDAKVLALFKRPCAVYEESTMCLRLDGSI